MNAVRFFILFVAMCGLLMDPARAEEELSGTDGLVKYIESLEARVKNLEMRDNHSSYFYWHMIESRKGVPNELDFQSAQTMRLGKSWELVSSGKALRSKRSGLYLISLSFVKDAYATGGRFHATRDDVHFQLYRNGIKVFEGWEGEDSVDSRAESTAFEVVCLNEGDELASSFRSDGSKPFRAYYPRLLIELYSFDSCEAK